MAVSNARLADEASRPALDLVHLARQTLGDPGLEREILFLFAKQSTSLLAVLARAIRPEERRAAAHTLKGSARAIGAWRVASAAERVEGGTSRRDVALLGGAVTEANALISSMLAA